MMDKKISQSDIVSRIDFVVDRTMSFKENIKIFSDSTGFPLSEDGSINFQKDDETCILSSLKLDNDIEMGYFDHKLKRPVRVTSNDSDASNMVALTFNFGSGLEQSLHQSEEVTKEGITNSIFINNDMIKTQTNVMANKHLHMFTIRYKKHFLLRHFSMANHFMNEIVTKEGPVIIYADFNQAIIQALLSMELHKIPSVTKHPFLLGKSLVLMSLVIELLENRERNKLLNINSSEFDRLLQAKNYIVQDWKNPPSVQQVSEFLGMSPTKAKVMFRQLFGKPIYTYFQEKRMAEALNLINEGKLTIAEIGHLLGYKNLGHFADSFKKQYGILPKRLSKSIKK